MNAVCIIVGSLGGTLFLPMATLLFHWLFFRPTLADGQYAFVFFLVVPIGFALGAVTGTVLALLSNGQLKLAGRVAQQSGGIVFGLLLLLGAFVLCGTGKASLQDRLSSTVFWCSTSLLWAGGLALYGTRLLLR